MVLKVPTTRRAIGFSKELRRKQTTTERMLWSKLRGNRFHGYKFRRQEPMGPFIVDFLCFQARLIVEIDGDSHWQPGAAEYDKSRDDYLQRRGFRVLRVQNQQVRESIDWVLEEIKAAVEAQLASP